MSLRSLTFYFLAVVLALFANTFVLYQNLQRMTEQQWWVNHTSQVLNKISTIDAKMRSMEAIARGYIVAPTESDFVTDFDNLSREVYDDVNQLQYITLDNPPQQEAIKELRQLIGARFDRWQTNIPKMRSRLIKGKDLTDLVRGGKIATEHLTSHLERMAEIETKLLNERTVTAASSRRVVFVTFAASFIVNLVLALAAFWLFRGSLRSQIQTIKEASYKAWIQDGMARISTILSGQITPEQVAEQSLAFFTETLGVPAGKFYVLQDNHLELLAAHAGSLKEHGSNRYRMGEGLVGTAAKSKLIHQITDVPADYFPIESSLGHANPKVLCFIPLSFQNVPVGIVEFAAFDPLTDQQMELLREAQERIGTVLNASINLRRQAELLEETQRQAEELQAQQEELRTNNEELEEQANALLRAQERQQAQQEELRQINEELEAQARTLEHQQEVVNQRNAQLEDAKTELESRAVELERSNLYKSEFLAKMSHELRTPLNSMLILSSLLGENKDKNLSDQQVEFSRTIYDAGSDLLNLINDILDLSKLEARKLALRSEPFALQSLFDSIESQFRPMTDRKDLDFSIQADEKVPTVLRTDRQRVEQVLRNFLSNAVKFTDSGRVTLKVSLSPRDKKRARFEVEDTGIGIPDEKKRKIFEAFEQVDSSISRKYGGTGLGLTISRELASLLQGKIEVESRAGAGSKFILEIPMEVISSENPEMDKDTVQRAEAAPAHEPQEARGAISREKVDRLLAQIKSKVKGESRTLLIVEDDASFVKALEKSAHSHGFTPLSVEDGETALEFLNHHVPAAILLDIKLPGISGMGVLESIKQRSHLRHVPIHIVSGLEYQIPALRLGAIGYLGKPVSVEGVKGAFEKIERILDKKMKQVLIVEDDERQVHAMQELLTGPGVQIVTAHSAREALDRIQEIEFECIIVDLSLPDVKDFELLEKIHEELGGHVPPIIIYTGRELTPKEEERLRAFSESIIIKGAKSPERLLDEVNLFLHRVESELPEDQRAMLSELRLREKSFDGRTVLLVDDDLRNIFALTSALESKGLKVVAARNGFEALETLEKHPQVDAVLMDIMMPKMDGFEATRRIRRQERFKNLPIIALTAKAMKGDQEKCIEAGANDYLPKPVNLMNLISVIKVWLAGKKAWS
jgi:CheY-like chemotaxis protein/signal transduction histidine kinase/CHASE3 domain sensor protein